MWISSLTASMRRPRLSSRVLLGAALAATLGLAAPHTARAQLTVFDPANHVENALQAARQLQSLTNEAQSLLNQARELAASPYSHLAETSQALKEMGQLARSIEGLASSLAELEGQFDNLYPTAVAGLDPSHALEQARDRTEMTRRTAQDLARTAAELGRLSQGREGRISGALSASQASGGQTAAIQSSTQVLAVLAEDLGALRAIMLAQSRLMAEESARAAAERAAAAEARSQYYGRESAPPSPPAFNPFANARN